LKEIMKRRMTSWLLGATGPIAVLALWEFATKIGKVDPIFLPAPSAVALAFLQLLISGELLFHAARSLGRLFVGYGIAAALGISIGLLIGWFRIVNQILKPLVELTRPVSPIALIPLAILWFGIGWESKIFVIAMGTFFPILLNTIAGVQNADPLLIKAARSLGANDFQILRTVAIPSAAPFIHTGLRVSLGIGFIVIIASEMVAAQNGLGWLVLDSQRVYRTDVVFVGIVSVSCLGLLGDYGMSKLGQILFPWLKAKERNHA
jgi:ABC-type nitrate/sulfonate/bicarbonate transport system permease component